MVFRSVFKVLVCFLERFKFIVVIFFVLIFLINCFFFLLVLLIVIVMDLFDLGFLMFWGLVLVCFILIEFKVDSSCGSSKFLMLMLFIDLVFLEVFVLLCVFNFCNWDLSIFVNLNLMLVFSVLFFFRSLSVWRLWLSDFCCSLNRLRLDNGLEIDFGLVFFFFMEEMLEVDVLLELVLGWDLFFFMRFFKSFVCRSFFFVFINFFFFFKVMVFCLCVMMFGLKEFDLYWDMVVWVEVGLWMCGCTDLRIIFGFFIVILFLFFKFLVSLLSLFIWSSESVFCEVFMEVFFLLFLVKSFFCIGILNFCNCMFNNLVIFSILFVFLIFFRYFSVWVFFFNFKSFFWMLFFLDVLVLKLVLVCVMEEWLVYLEVFLFFLE